MRTLFGLHSSPWTEKARFALDYQRVDYAYEEYVPLLGELVVRLRARKPLVRVTVPLLLDGRAVVPDSLAIARRADALGDGKRPLFPAAHDALIVQWNDRSERALGAARGLAIYRTRQDPAAQAEALPSFVPAPMRSSLRPVAQLGVAFLQRKYRSSAASTFEQEGILRDVLDELRAALDGGSHTYLVGGALTYADVTMAAVMHAVKPVQNPRVALGDATRALWTHEELARHYGDLLAWRDAIYATHRAS